MSKIIIIITEKYNSNFKKFEKEADKKKVKKKKDIVTLALKLAPNIM